MTESSISVQKARQAKVRTIGIVAYDGMEIIDLTGPLDVFALTSYGFQLAGIAKENVYPINLLAKEPGLVTACNGLKVHADSAYGDIRDGLDTLLIPGAPDVKCLLSDPLLQDWIRAISPSLRSAPARLSMPRLSAPRPRPRRIGLTDAFPSEIDLYVRRTTIFDYLFRDSLANLSRFPRPKGGAQLGF